MDINKIFNIFSPGVEIDEENNILDIYQHPAYKIGMFKKLISNISNAVLFSVKIMNKNDNVEDVSEFIKSQVFRKAFEFLEEVNFEQHKDIIKNNLDPVLKKSLELSLEYFISTEEYEKCSVLKNFLDLY